MSDKTRLEALARMIKAEIENAPPNRAQLRLIELPQKAAKVDCMDALLREGHYRRIRYMAGAYKLQWLVDQATFHCLNIEDLSDDDLVALTADMDRARECPEFDVSYEERGLVRNRA